MKKLFKRARIWNSLPLKLIHERPTPTLISGQSKINSDEYVIVERKFIYSKRGGYWAWQFHAAFFVFLCH